MIRLLRTALLVTTMMALAAPVALADSSAWRSRTMDCGSAGTMTFLLPPSEFYAAAVPVPFHEVDGTSVLTALKVTVDGNTWVSKPLAAKGGGRLVTCGYTDPAGYVIEIAGLLTPAH